MLDPHDAETIRCLRELDRRLAPAIDRILAARGTTWAAYRLTLPPMGTPTPSLPTSTTAVGREAAD
jgi:hypothetical protein